MLLLELPEPLLLVVGALLGLLFGSFLNVVIHRLPRDESIAFPGSHCTSCDAPIAAYDNIPVLSWLILRGKARCCKSPIPSRYPLVEALGGLFATALVIHMLTTLSGMTPFWHASLVFLAYLAFGLGLVALTFIDLETMLLPDELTLGGAALGLVTAGLRGITYESSAVGAALGFCMIWLPFDVLYRALRGHAGMGLGDAKLVMMAGAWFGWPGAVFALLAGATQGTVVALVTFAVGGTFEEPEAVKQEREEARKLLDSLEGEEREQFERELSRDPLASPAEAGLGKTRLPFGPFLALATIEYLFFGAWIEQEFLWMLLES